MPKFTKSKLGLLLITVFLLASGCGKNDHNIMAIAGTGGSISPSGTSTVKDGSSLTFTITPNTGYSITDVKVDGSSVGAVTTYTFTNVTSDHAIEATFTMKAHTITATAGTGGSILPSGLVIVNDGATQTFTITPNTGYSVLDVKVGGSSVGALTTYTFTNVTSNHAIEVTFVMNTYTITAVERTGGSILPSGSVIVNNGATQTFTITPNTGYSVLDVKVDGSSVGALTTYTFTNITFNHTIEVAFMFQNNIINNSEFDDSLNYWNISIDTEAKLTVKLDNSGILSGQNSIQYNIENGGLQAYHVQLWQPVPLVKNKTYVINLKVKIEGTTNATLYLKCQQSQTYNPYTIIEVPVNDTETNYGPFVFNSTEDDSSAEFLIFLGTINNVKIWLDAISIK